MLLKCPLKHNFTPCANDEERNSDYSELLVQNGGPFPGFLCQLCSNGIQEDGASLTCGTCRIDICQNCFIPLAASVDRLQDLQYQFLLNCSQQHKFVACLQDRQRMSEYVKFSQEFDQPDLVFQCDYCGRDLDEDEPSLTCPPCLADICGRCAISRFIKEAQTQ